MTIVMGLLTGVSFAETKKSNPIKSLNSFNSNMKKLQMSEKKNETIIK